tara:strand:- start:289 stop:453 length:165 start_codon:yes stop_codon:yes gene_type:complete
MKTGDMVKVKGRPEYGSGKIIRFYANQSTVLVEFDKEQAVIYCDYSQLEDDESR